MQVGGTSLTCTGSPFGLISGPFFLNLTIGSGGLSKGLEAKVAKALLLACCVGSSWRCSCVAVSLKLPSCAGSSRATSCLDLGRRIMASFAVLPTYSSHPPLRAYLRAVLVAAKDLENIGRYREINGIELYRYVHAFVSSSLTSSFFASLFSAINPSITAKEASRIFTCNSFRFPATATSSILTQGVGDIPGNGVRQ